LFISVLGLAACAEGGAIDPSGSGSGAGSSTGPGGQGGSGGDTSITSSTNATSTSSGPSCSESPCKLVEPQCGCDVGEQCTIGGDYQRTCAQQNLEHAQHQWRTSRGQPDGSEYIGHRVGVAHFRRPSDQQQPCGEVGEEIQRRHAGEGYRPTHESPKLEMAAGPLPEVADGRAGMAAHPEGSCTLAP